MDAKSHGERSAARSLATRRGALLRDCIQGGRGQAMARPTKLTPELADRICQSLRAGVPDIYAAEGNGIDRSTFWQWIELGKKAAACEVQGCSDLHHGPETGELTYVEFVDRTMVAEADAVRLAVGYVTRAMPTDPVNARWWLERRHPAAFKPRSEVEMTGDPEREAPFTIVLVPNDRPEVRALDAKPGGESPSDAPALNGQAEAH